MSQEAESSNSRDWRITEAEYPTEGEYVLVTTRRVNKDAGYVTVHLQQYGKDGMITFGDMTRQKVKHKQHITKVGDRFVAHVTTVDISTQNIVLSKHDVTETDIVNFHKFYFWDIKIQSMVKTVAIRCKVSPHFVLRQFVWPLYRTWVRLLAEREEDPDALLQHHPAFRLLHHFTSADASSSEGLFAPLAPDAPAQDISAYQAIETMLREVVIKQMQSNKTVLVKMCATIVSLKPDGVTAIQTAVRAALASHLKKNISVHMVRSPIYEFSCASDNTEETKAILRSILDTIHDTLSPLGYCTESASR